MSAAKGDAGGRLCEVVEIGNDIFDNSRKRRYSASRACVSDPAWAGMMRVTVLPACLRVRDRTGPCPGVAWLGAMTPGLAAWSEAFGQRTGAHLADGGELTAKVCVLPFQRRNLFIGHDRVLVLTVHPLIDVGRSSLVLYPGTNPLTFLTCSPRPVVACAGGEDMVQSAALRCIKRPSGAGKTEIPAQRRTEHNGDSGRRRDRDAAL